MNPVRIGLAGYGYWGPNLMRVLQERDDTQVVACCDPNPIQRRRMALRYPTVQPVATLPELLAAGIDAVVLATPISQHAEGVMAALEQGKHVFVEKPLCTTVEQAEFLVQRAEQQGVVLAVGHTFLYSPAVLAVHAAIASGQLGDLHYISSSRVNLDAYRHDTNVLWDLAVHDLSILHFWIGESPLQVQVAGRGCARPDSPDIAFLSLSFPGGVIAHIEVSWLAPSKLRRMVVAGSRQMAVFDDTEVREKLRFHQRTVMPAPPENFGEFQLCCRQGDILVPWLETREPLALEMEDFILSIRHGGMPRSHGRLGAEIVRTLVRLQQCWEEQVPPMPSASASLALAPVNRRLPWGVESDDHIAAS
jgi:predicted dehydrogenase